MIFSKRQCERSSNSDLFVPSPLWFLIPTVDLMAAAVLILSEKVTDYHWKIVVFNELGLATISYIIYSYKNYKAGNYF
jgi:hypothetical protein